MLDYESNLGGKTKAEQKRDRAADALRDRLSAFVHGMKKEADKRVQARQTQEQRWLRDLRQMHGEYDAAELARIREGDGSEVFVNFTRPKANALAARLSDLLFPTDDRNWSVSPTPVPEMDTDMKERDSIVRDARQTVQHREQELVSEAEASGEDSEAAVQAAQDLQEAQDVLTEAEEAQDELRQLMREASDRAELMEREIEDNLVECGYAKTARQVIDDAVAVGAGVMKGPIAGTEVRQRWARGEDGTFVLETSVSDATPAASYVDYWAYFPDPNSADPSEGEGDFERHLLNAKQLRRLARRPDMNEDGIRRILRGKGDTLPEYVQQLQSLVERQTSGVTEGIYVVWEYTGPIAAEALSDLAEVFDDEAARKEATEADPLSEISVRLWFCDDEILSFGLHPLDTAESIYSMYRLVHEEYGPWGYGIPWVTRNSQAIANGAARMLMDNAGFSTAPILEVDPKVVEGEDGAMSSIGPRMKLRRKENADPNRPALREYRITSYQKELQAILELGKQLIDEESGIPVIAQGEQGTMVQQTATGMSLLMNSANVTFRRLVKAWDDDITVPLMHRFYDWHMQFSDKDEIKGDYEVNARGASVLLVREMQAQNLLVIAQNFGDHPVYGAYLRSEEMLRAIFRSLMLPTHDLVMTKSEIAEEKEQESPDPTPEQIEAQADMELEELKHKHKVEQAQIEGQTRVTVAQLQRESDLIKLASQENLTLADIEARLKGIQAKTEADLQAKRIEADAREKSLAVEVAMRERTGLSSGGAV